MPKSSGINPDRQSEEDLYKANQTLFIMAKKSGSLTDDIKTGKKKEGDAARKKKNALKRPVEMSEEEAVLVGKAVKSIMEDIKSGKTKTYSIEDVITRENKRRGLD